MRNTKKTIFILLYTVLFSALIFIGKEIFYPSTYSEEQYIEPVLWSGFSDIKTQTAEFGSFSWTTQEQINDTIHALIYESFKEKYSQDQRDKVFLRYIPTILWENIEYSYVPLVEVFLYKKDILSHIKKLGVFFYKNRDETRGRMKWWNIHLYGVESFSDSEFLSVLLHEFWHYYDIYSLPGNAFGDVSQNFYNISWDSTTKIKKWQQAEDFVSWYSMTNQYEDFAESYVYYILHNKDFLEKTKNSAALSGKYEYLRDYVFQRNQFTWEDFSSDSVSPYYWDITKIWVDVKKFLQYMQEAI